MSIKQKKIGEEMINEKFFQEKNIVITGGTTGIGRATAVILAQLGADVFIYGRHQQELDDALADIERTGRAGHGSIADQAEYAQVKKVFEKAREQLGGPIDILVNNAALGAGGMLDGSFENWEYVIRTNILGYIAATEQVIPDMSVKGEGHIINIGSMSANVREGESSLYVATKAAIQGWSESLRKEVNTHGIRVTLVEMRVRPHLQEI